MKIQNLKFYGGSEPLILKGNYVLTVLILIEYLFQLFAACSDISLGKPKYGEFFGVGPCFYKLFEICF